MTLIFAPVSASKSGARRWSGSATCGPLNVSRLTSTPVKSWPAADCAGRGLGAGRRGGRGRRCGRGRRGRPRTGCGDEDRCDRCRDRTVPRHHGGPSSCSHPFRPAYWTDGGRLDIMVSGRYQSRCGTRFSMLTGSARNSAGMTQTDDSVVIGKVEFGYDPEAAGEADSLAPAVTRAAVILDLLAENGGVAAGPSELARRLGLPKSSIANICAALADAGLARRVGTGFALGRKLAELGGAYLASVDQVQEFYDACHELRGRVGRDHPARGPRRDRDDLPRPPRRTAARAADLPDRTAPARQRDGDRQGGPRPARARRGRAPVRGRPAPDPDAPLPAERRSPLRRSRRRPRTGLLDGRRGDRRRRRLLRGRDPGPGARARARTRRASRCSRRARRSIGCRR